MTITTRHVRELDNNLFMQFLVEFMEDARRRGVDVELKLPQSYKPVKVIYNGITTVAIFSDGQKIISRPSADEWFDKETGLAMCIAKRVYGGRGQFLKAVEGATVQAVKSEDSCSMGWVEALNEIVNSLSRFVAESKKETDEQ